MYIDSSGVNALRLSLTLDRTEVTLQHNDIQAGQALRVRDVRLHGFYPISHQFTRGHGSPSEDRPAGVRIAPIRICGPKTPPIFDYLRVLRRCASPAMLRIAYTEEDVDRVPVRVTRLTLRTVYDADHENPRESDFEAILEAAGRLESSVRVIDFDPDAPTNR